MTESRFEKQNTVPDVVALEKEQTAIALPEKIGPYKVEALLEKGGMSILYLATHPDTGEPLTIKVLLPKFVSHPEMVQRFINEAEIIALADHPNIVKLYGHGEWEGGLYIAMEYIQGISLRDYIAKKPLSLRRALEVVLEISYAICHLHTHGVIHRDLKPENILVTESGAIKVIDFGIAQLLGDDQGKPLVQQRFIGTPVYMSPEQRLHPDKVSYPSDIYSLGIITYELILGRLSYGQIHLSLMPKGIQKILSKALQPNLEDRYQDIVDFISEISGYLNTVAQGEAKESDKLSDLADDLQRAKESLLPRAIPQWPKIDLGLISHKGVTLSGIYYDFFELADGCFGVLLAEPASRGAEGLIYTAVFRGLVRALSHLVSKPSELVTLLNELLTHDPMDQVFTLSYLVLSPNTNQLQYISCGYGNLWHIPAGINEPTKVAADNMALGIDAKADFIEVSQPWNVGDTVILNTFAIGGDSEAAQSLGLPQDSFKKALADNVFKPPQKLVEILFHKMRASMPHLSEDRALALIGILRKD